VAWIEARTTRSGKVRYRAYWRDPSGKISGKVFARKRDAEAHGRLMEQWKAEGTYFDPARGIVWRRLVGEHRDWRRWATVPISDARVMKYAWDTSQAPYANGERLVMFSIKGHGESNRVRVKIWAGE
jgi:hypothetical protein